MDVIEPMCLRCLGRFPPGERKRHWLPEAGLRCSSRSQFRRGCVAEQEPHIGVGKLKRQFARRQAAVKQHEHAAHSRYRMNGLDQLQ